MSVLEGGETSLQKHKKTAAASGELGVLRTESTLYCLFHSHKSLISESHLVVDDHHVVAVRTQPGVHGLADAADFVQGWSVVVRPAKVQHLREDRGRQSD